MFYAGASFWTKYEREGYLNLIKKKNLSLILTTTKISRFMRVKIKCVKEEGLRTTKISVLLVT